MQCFVGEEEMQLLRVRFIILRHSDSAWIPEDRFQMGRCFWLGNEVTGHGSVRQVLASY